MTSLLCGQLPLNGSSCIRLFLQCPLSGRQIPWCCSPSADDPASIRICAGLAFHNRCRLRSEGWPTVQEDSRSSHQASSFQFAQQKLHNWWPSRPQQRAIFGESMRSFRCVSLVTTARKWRDSCSRRGQSEESSLGTPLQGRTNLPPGNRRRWSLFSLFSKLLANVSAWAFALILRSWRRIIIAV